MTRLINICFCFYNSLFPKGVISREKSKGCITMTYYVNDLFYEHIIITYLQNMYYVYDIEDDLTCGFPTLIRVVVSKVCSFKIYFFRCGPVDHFVVCTNFILYSYT